MSTRLDKISDWIYCRNCVRMTDIVDTLLINNECKSEDLENYINPETNKPNEIQDWILIDYALSTYVRKHKKPLLKFRDYTFWGRPTCDSFNEDGIFVAFAYDKIIQNYALDIISTIKHNKKFFTLPSGSHSEICSELLCCYKGLLHISNIAARKVLNL